MDDCLFCKIASGSTISTSIYADDLVFAFLDAYPIREGHTQIIPWQHYATFDELPAGTASRIIHVGQKIGRALKQVFSVERAAFIFTGGDIPHAHAHVLPMHEKTDITSRLYIVEKQLTFRSVARVSNEQLALTASRIKPLL